MAAGIQLEAAIPNFAIHETHPTNTLQCIRQLGTADYQPVNGYIEVPELPGLGIDLSDYALKHSVITTIK